MLKSVCAFLVASVLASGVADAAAGDPEVKVTGGKIQGYVDSNGVKTFKGIPYADTTAGENRWKAPQPVKHWKGTLECKDFGPIAIQNPVPARDDNPGHPWTPEYLDVAMTLENGQMGEDCLRVNVWTQANEGDKLPVIVYIHGGANITGSGGNDVYDGSAIAQKGVVYVSINYRVGLLGFLAFKDVLGNEVRGNFALQDQIEALKWVQKNISKFGGDPDNVTIMGQSAGSMNVQTLIVSPAAKGLFNRAVYLSFNGYKSDLLRINSVETAEAESAKELRGYLLSDLRKLSAQELLDLKYAPSNAVIDGDILESTIKDAYNSGNFNKVDTICGFVSGDPYLLDKCLDLGMFFEPKTSLSLSEYWDLVPDKNLGRMYDPESNPLAAAKAINNDYLAAGYYWAAKTKDMNDPDHNSFVYFFDHTVPDTPERMAKFGAFHTGDVNYWLNHYTTVYPRNFTDYDHYLGDVMSSYLVNFAATGDPNDGYLPYWESVKDSPTVSYMYLGDVVEFELMEPDKADFWTHYVKTY